ncbi:MAG: glycolate oxidase subunit GlcE [Pseudomonadota bacterium]|nr:glycolate oxidase subunit GlcE [Pseudomonadota bacterium]
MGARGAALQRLTDRVMHARDAKIALDIRGGSTKCFYGNAPHGDALDVRELAGITSYEPTELVVTALAGTPLAELEAVLGDRGQCLPFEPPRFAAPGTVGGMVAAGLAGPARASVGPLRDFVLGVTLLNGMGETLTFGGQVMKNVAGYDVSRLIAGSMGILGVICQVSLKVMPSLPACRTLCFDLDEGAALKQLNRWAGQAIPLSASAWYEGRLQVRLAGANAAVAGVHERLGGRDIEPEVAHAWWSDVRDQHHPFFAIVDGDLQRGECLWRLSVPDTAPPLSLPGAQFIEWGGAQRWWRSAAPATIVRSAAAAVGGHATLVRAADKSPGAFAPLPQSLLHVHQRLKKAFDPEGIFNPGRMYPEL